MSKEQSPVTITMDLDSVVGERRAYDADGDPYYVPVTLIESVLERGAELLLAEISAEVRADTARRIRDIRDEMIREALAPHVMVAVESPFQRTNTYGVPQGSPVTIRELVVEAVTNQAKECFTTTANRSGTESVLVRMIRETVPKVIAGELAETVAQAKADLRKRVAASTAQVLADAVVSAVTK